MEIKVEDFTIYKNSRDDLAFIISYTGSKDKDMPVLIYERSKNSAILKKSNDIVLFFRKININAIAALKKLSRIYVVETKDDNVCDEYWVNIKIG